jgi:tartrate-resistant acid phosphatase type 5
MRRIGLFIIINFYVYNLSVFSQSTDSPDSNLRLTINKKALNFIAMGDWGRNGEYKQREVANQMGIAAKALGTDFFIATGDNFYPSGVASTQDHRWIDSYEDIYTAHSLQNDWYVVPGNHDYKGNVQAEIDYTKIDRRWYMPARFYSKKMILNNDTTKQILLVFIDTTPLLSEYYLSPEHADVKTQDTAMQRKWLESVLSDSSPNIKWKIVAGHHPLYTGGKRMNADETKELHDLLRPIFEKYKVDAYICGHEHSLQYIKPDGRTHYFISGAGSETTPAILHPDGGKFAISENGFIAFTITPDEMLAQIISYKGDVLFKKILKK